MTNRILLVDDEAKITTALQMLFERAGYEVQVAHSGQQALELLATAPDLLLLDVMLPDIDGFVICQQVRQNSAVYLPILMLTARDALPDKVMGLELGADVYLTKPFEPNELLAQVRALLRLAGKREDGERPLSCGPLTLWPAQHRVYLVNTPLDLTPTEFSLLHLFMRRPGQVFGRETLLRDVWGYDFLGDSRTVDVHIQRLRSKIEPTEDSPKLLLTVRGFGYRLVGE